jgi:hypothetical protein
MPHRVRNTGKPVPLTPPSPPSGAPFAGREPEKVPGTRLREIHTHIADRVCSTCREDLAVPELNYRVVLRCSSAGPDH